MQMQRQNYNLLLKNERVVQSIFDNLHPKTIRVIKEELKLEQSRKPEPPFTPHQFYTIVGVMTAVFTVLSFFIRWDILLVQYASFWAFLVIYQKGFLARATQKSVNIFPGREGKLKVTAVK